MSWRDRPYARTPIENGGLSLGMPKPTPIVGRIMIVCAVVFVATALARTPDSLYGNFVYQWFSLALPPLAPLWQVWRWVSYQYVHGGPWHFILNMLGLYFFGPPLERLWGGRRFFAFYTLCGVAAGLAFAMLQVAFGAGGYLIGASGSILGCLAACAILFPRQVIILLFFPLPIRFAALLLAAVFAANVLWKKDLSDAAHFAGMLAGAGWVYAGWRWPTAAQCAGSCPRC